MSAAWQTLIKGAVIVIALIIFRALQGGREMTRAESV